MATSWSWPRHPNSLGCLIVHLSRWMVGLGRGRGSLRRKTESVQGGFVWPSSSRSHLLTYTHPSLPLPSLSPPAPLLRSLPPPLALPPLTTPTSSPRHSLPAAAAAPPATPSSLPLPHTRAGQKKAQCGPVEEGRPRPCVRVGDGGRRPPRASSGGSTHKIQ